MSYIRSIRMSIPKAKDNLIIGFTSVVGDMMHAGHKDTIIKKRNRQKD